MLLLKDREFFLNTLENIRKTSQFNSSRSYIQHGSTSVYDHSINVAYNSFRLVKFLHIKCDYSSLIRGALLHDYYLYDWHKPERWHKYHGFRHPLFAFKNAEKIYKLTVTEENIIKRHMFPLTIKPPTHKESIVVCIIDKYCALYETFIA